MTKKLNFRINPTNDFLYDRVTVATTPIRDRQWSPGAGTPQRIQRAPFSESSAVPPSSSSSRNGNHNNNNKNGHRNGGVHGRPESSVEMMRQARSSSLSAWQKNPTSTYIETPQNGTYPTEEHSQSSSVDSALQLVEEDSEYSSNERLLLIAFVTFITFSLTQMYFAFRAESEAMKGDSAAMIVDSFTYLFNWVAERSKHLFDRHYTEPPGLTPERAVVVRQRTKRKAILKLEIMPPLVSVATLLAVTGIVFREAWRVILLDFKRDVGEQSDPNIDLMMMFSLINLALDGVNFCCFAKSSHLFGFDTTTEESKNYNTNGKHDGGMYFTINGSNNRKHQNRELDFWMDDDDDDAEQSPHHHANLNMCSAYTHVFADTLRSVAVVIAAALAELFDEVTAEEADAAAALVVSILIFLSLVPLFRGLLSSVYEFMAIRAEERSEIMMEEIEQEERIRRNEA